MRNNHINTDGKNQELCENWGWFIDIDKNYSSFSKKYTNKYRTIKPKIYDLPVIREEEENNNIYKFCGNNTIFQIISTSFISCIIIYVVCIM